MHENRENSHKKQLKNLFISIEESVLYNNTI